MLDFLIRKFIPNYEDVKDPAVREKYGVLGGGIGVVCNLILFIIKLGAGLLIGSIAVVSDAFNNLSDWGSSLVSVIGARLSVKRADEKHPYGHGRAEYISALIIAFIIILFGAELLKTSAVKIFNPTDVVLGKVSFVLLLLSVPVKLWMWYCDKKMGEKIESEILLAAAKDSLNDTAATSAVIASALISSFLPVSIDGAAGVCVSALVIYSGIKIAWGTIDRLMGEAPDAELISKIENMILCKEGIIGMHDLLIHDYGPGHKIASAHAELPSDMSLTEAHRIIDEAEHEIMRELGVDIVIHIDPILFGK